MMETILTEIIFFALPALVILSCSKKIVSKSDESKQKGRPTAGPTVLRNLDQVQSSTPISCEPSLTPCTIEKKKTAFASNTSTSNTRETLAKEPVKVKTKESTSRSPKKQPKKEETKKSAERAKQKMSIEEKETLQKKSPARETREKAQEPSQNECDKEVSPRPADFERELHFSKKEKPKPKQDDSTESTQLS